MQQVLLVTSAVAVIAVVVVSRLRRHRRRADRPTGMKREASARLVEPGLAAPLRDPAFSRARRRRRRQNPDPRSNGHAKQDGHGTLR